MLDLTSFVEDACRRLTPYGPGVTLWPPDCEVFSWPQTWSDSTCGFGGGGGQAMTAVQCVVVVGPVGDACVYHGRFAKHVQRPSEKFFAAMRVWRMPGARDSWSGMERP